MNVAIMGDNIASMCMDNMSINNNIHYDVDTSKDWQGEGGELLTATVHEGDWV